MNVITKTVQLPDGRTITIETGKVAKQADGSAVVRMGNTVILATVCAAKDAVPGTDFMPLQVDYREQYSAAGRFPGGFTKREGKPSDGEILVSRIVDRVLRPLFPSDYHCEVFVQLLLVSADHVEQPDALAAFAASAAIACSDIPIDFPISEVRVGRINGQFVIDPTFDQMKDSDIDLMVGATKENIMMIEGEMNEISEEDLIEGMKAGFEAIKPMCEIQEELSKELGTDKKREYEPETNDEELRKEINTALYPKVYELYNKALDKMGRGKGVNDIFDGFIAQYDERHVDLADEELAEKHVEAKRYYSEVCSKALRNQILNDHVRVDGRKTDEVRSIWCEVSPLPMPHGSSIFSRGETMSLSTCTLGTKLDEKQIDDVLDHSFQRFLLHYNFPPFAVGEAKAQRSVGRREIGHGHLAWRALYRQIPEDFPYTVRLVSEILESNGSSSMATVCGGTLALMDAGVPIKKTVSGISMGLVTDPEDTSRYELLTDILGDEDHLGDMDFKTAGTRDGITATQMDIKVDGVSFEVLAKALEQAKIARHHILDVMEETMPEPRKELKPQAPRIISFSIPKEFIGAIIGPGGKIIQQMQEETGATITIDEEDNVGKVQISGGNQEIIDAAKAKIDAIAAVPEVGKVYEGTVRSIMPYGCFVEILPGKDGLLHISEIAWKHLDSVEDAGIHEGDKISVKLMAIDEKTGKYKLSHRVLLDKPDDYSERERRPRRNSRDNNRNNNHGHRRNDDRRDNDRTENFDNRGQQDENQQELN